MVKVSWEAMRFNHFGLRSYFSLEAGDCCLRQDIHTAACFSNSLSTFIYTYSEYRKLSKVSSIHKVPNIIL